MVVSIPFDRAIAQAVRPGFSRRRPGFEPRSGYVGFVVDKVALGKVFSEYFGFPCQFSFHWLLHTHHHPPFGTGTIVQIVLDVPNWFSFTPPQVKTRYTVWNATANLGVHMLHSQSCRRYCTRNKNSSHATCRAYSFLHHIPPLFRDYLWAIDLSYNGGVDSPVECCGKTGMT
jgi:hypothetical protein